MNMILNTDSYKPSHWLQYPPNTEYVFQYAESRGSAGDDNLYGRFDMPTRIPEAVYFGPQIFYMNRLSKPISREDIEEAEEFFKVHGEPFNKEGWEHILNKHGGYLPLEIKSVAEGKVIPTKNVLLTIVNTDPVCFWLPSYVETSLLRSIWYGTTVATVSWRIKQLIKSYMQKTSDSLDGLEFKLHDFGARGVSSEESAGIGGAAHLINFMGSDTISGVLTARKYYDEPMAGFSIPAAEHSSITTWGRDKEVDAYRNMLNKFAKPGSLVAVVSDSYNIYNAARNIWGKVLKEEVIKSGATIIIRPDSGDPTSTVLQVIEGLADGYGYRTNTKGYKVLNNVRVIQGDGIDETAINFILRAMEINGWSADNIAFGMGGALLQQPNRDTLKFAMKTSAAKVDGNWIDVYKDPVGDSGKLSKKGRFTLNYNTETGEYSTGKKIEHPYYEDALETVFLNGEVVKKYTFKEVRENANK